MKGNPHQQNNNKIALKKTNSGGSLILNSVSSRDRNQNKSKVEHGCMLHTHPPLNHSLDRAPVYICEDDPSSAACISVIEL